MKIRTLLATAFVLALASTVFAHPKNDHKLVQFQMAIMKKGPNWNSMTTEARNATRQQHLANVISLMNSGKVVIAGPFNDSTDLAGIFVYRVSSPDEAKALVASDPAVKAGLMVGEVHPWFSQDIFRKAESPLKMETLYFGFLKKGPNRKEGDGDTPEVQNLQKAHIANIERLAKLGKVVAAGPFGDEGELRGIFVFRVGSMKEAQDLAATDPMIKIDRLRIDLHPWNVPLGVLP